MSLEQQVQELLDRQAINDLIARYSRTLDWLDDDGQAGCYWPDAAVDYGFFKGTAAEFVPVVMAVERSTGRRWHLLSSLAVKLTSPTTCTGERKNKSRERATTPSLVFSMPTTPNCAAPAAVAWNTSSKLAQ